MSKDAASGERPDGLEAINRACSKLYPNQPNPLQVTALVKYWLGGPDPLDYITMYYNTGEASTNSTSVTEAHAAPATPPHWHYVSCGFSDLHGDNRVHKRAPGLDNPSGFGFELSFRLCSDMCSPPTWPAELLQSLARYVFSSGNMLCIGDHISWHAALDQQESRLQHMLLASDPQLPPIQSSLGTVQFIQVVGITSEELTAAQAWNGMGILKLMKANPQCGGELLVTDMRRDESLFDLVPEARVLVDEGVEAEGSLLSGVSALCLWEDGLGAQPSTTSPNSLIEPELLQITKLEEVHLKFNIEALRLLPLALRGRLNHGRHFTFKSLHGEMAITLLSGGVEGGFASESCPLVAHGPWLQVYLGHKESSRILSDVDQLLAQKIPLAMPASLEWSEMKLRISVIQ